MYLEVAQLIFFILSPKRIRAELFTSLKDIEPLIPTHNNVAEQIENYLEHEQVKLERLKRYLTFFKKDEKIMKTDDGFANNPINAFSLIHKLTQELRVIEDELWIKGEPKLSAFLDLPSEADLQGAILALLRLQRTYDMDVTQLAAGIINTHGNKLYIKKTSPMTISATFQVGQRLFKIGLFEMALHWMYEALYKYYHRDVDDPYIGDEFNIIDYIRQAHQELKEFRSAKEWVEILMQLRPTQSHLYKKDMIFYQNQLQSGKSNTKGTEVDYQKASTDILEPFIEISKNQSLYCFYKNGPHAFLLLAPIKIEILCKDPNLYLIHDIMSEASERIALPPKHLLKKESVIITEVDELDEEEENIFNRDRKISRSLFEEDTVDPLCRGEVSMTEDAKKRLYCFFKNGPSAFLLLAPAKTELLGADPDVYLFHDAISDAEIAFVINASLPMLKRSMVTTRIDDDENLRLRQTCWLEDDLSPIILRLTLRVSEFTGLGFETAENLQVANYGVGGHYDTHWDFANKMSDVEQGGATVFFHHNLTVLPVKKTAIFWKNVLPTGKPDLRTIHAGCPVLIGSKWGIYPQNRYRVEEIVRENLGKKS